MSILASFCKSEACGQRVLLDRSILVGQKLVKNAKIQMRHFEEFSNNVIYIRFKSLQNIWIFPPKIVIFENSKMLQTETFWRFLPIMHFTWFFFTNFLPIQWAGKLILFDLWFSHFAFFQTIAILFFGPNLQNQKFLGYVIIEQ